MYLDANTHPEAPLFGVYDLANGYWVPAVQRVDTEQGLAICYLGRDSAADARAHGNGRFHVADGCVLYERPGTFVLALAPGRHRPQGWDPRALWQLAETRRRPREGVQQ